MEKLHPHQALLWINRWTKLQNRWYKKDRDVLYELKTSIISQWVTENAMKATRVIQRDTPAIAGMRTEIASGGAKLGFLNYYSNDWRETLQLSPNFEHWSILEDFDNNNITIPLAAKVLKQIETNYEQALIRNRNAQIRYEQEKIKYLATSTETTTKLRENVSLVHKILVAYQKTAPTKQERKQIHGALYWLKTQQVSDNQWHQIQKILLQSKNLIPSIDIPVPPLPPTKPTEPRLYESIDTNEYIEGTIHSIDKAIEWARIALNKPNLDLQNLGGAVYDLEEIIANEALSYLKSCATDIFEDVITGKLRTPEEVYSDLDTLELDYSSAIGMNTYTNRQNNNESVQSNYSNWHKINLDLYGYWLVEFLSSVDSTICFHIPYSQCLDLIDVTNLPTEHSTQEQFGRAIDLDEQQLYPIEDLLGIFNMSKDNFPEKLYTYCQTINYDFLYDDDDDDHEEDF